MEIVHNIDLGKANRKWIRLCVLFGVIILGATVFGQISGDRFPSYDDLVVSLFFPAGIYLIFAPIYLVICHFQPVKTSQKGLLCTNYYSQRRFIEWSKIEDIYPMNTGGFNYACFKPDGFDVPFVIPLDLQDFGNFMQEIKRCAGSNSELFCYLQDQA